jgi:hypothetical protein
MLIDWSQIKGKYKSTINKLIYLVLIYILNCLCSCLLCIGCLGRSKGGNRSNWEFVVGLDRKGFGALLGWFFGGLNGLLIEILQKIAGYMLILTF